MLVFRECLMLSDPARSQGGGGEEGGGGVARTNPSKIYPLQKNCLRFRTQEHFSTKKFCSEKNVPLSEHSPQSSCNNNPTTITVQCEIPPTYQISAQCKQCLCTHGPVSLLMFTRYCTCKVHNIHTIINPRTQCL